MARKTGLEIKKAILRLLKEKECSLRELETKINTNYLTIRNHCKELEFFKFVEIIGHKKSKKTGRPYTTVRITKEGINLFRN